MRVKRVPIHSVRFNLRSVMKLTRMGQIPIPCNVQSRRNKQDCDSPVVITLPVYNYALLPVELKTRENPSHPPGNYSKLLLIDLYFLLNL